MAKSYVGVMLDIEVHKRVDALKTRLSELFRGKPGALGLGATIGLLLDHWGEAPPSDVWLVKTLRNYPKRGKPTRLDPVSSMNDYWLRYHYAKVARSRPRIAFCVNCGEVWDRDRRDRFENECAFKTEAGITKEQWIALGNQRPPWVTQRSEWLRLGFDDDEITWLHEPSRSPLSASNAPQPLDSERRTSFDDAEGPEARDQEAGPR